MSPKGSCVEGMDVSVSSAAYINPSNLSRFFGSVFLPLIHVMDKINWNIKHLVSRSNADL
jgi:hypothetical protein